MAIAITINGQPREINVPPEMPLLWVLRDELGLVGTKYGCGGGFCGACTVHLDGQPRRSCQTAVGIVGSAKVTTIEAIGETREGAALQAAWIDHDVPQCGYCQTGQIMSAAALLRRDAHPTTTAIESAMVGNVCRCASYHRIVAAIADAGATLTDKTHG